MRESLTRIFVGLPVAGPVLISDPAIRSMPAVFGKSRDCDLIGLSRTYRFSFAGYVNTGAPIYFTPVAAAGTIEFRPDGSISRSFTVNAGGSLFPVNDSFDYSLNGDCTFTASLPVVGVGTLTRP